MAHVDVDHPRRMLYRNVGVGCIAGLLGGPEQQGRGLKRIDAGEGIADALGFFRIASERDQVQPAVELPFQRYRRLQRQRSRLAVPAKQTAKRRAVIEAESLEHGLQTGARLEPMAPQSRRVQISGVTGPHGGQPQHSRPGAAGPIAVRRGGP